jgi:N-acetylmuramoyl-L-alanine amidase
MAVTLQSHALKAGLAGNRAIPAEGFWRQNLAICRDTRCAAVLTENLFQDNTHDVDYLLSTAGFNTIVDVHVDAIKQLFP